MRMAVLIPLAVLIGCGAPSNGEQTGTTAPVGTVTDGQGRTSTVHGSDNAAAIPKDRPAWARVYPGSKIVQVLIDTSAAPGGTISYITADPVAKVAAFYDAALSAAGKKPGPKADTAEAAVRFVGDDGGSNGGTITISQENAMTAVTVIYQK